ncbi:DMT family transporter [Ideonella sp. B7]|nr:DMT family transporter [Ideonella benzenivorans]
MTALPTPNTPPLTAGTRPAPTPVPGPLDARAIGAMSILCVLWGLQQISLKAAAPVASPMLMVAVRSLVALLLLSTLMWQRGDRPDPRHRRAGALVGSLFALEFLLVAEALRFTQASHVVVFQYTAPLFAALGLHARLPAERLGRLQWVGIALAFGGIALAFLGGHAGPGDSAIARVLLGDALALMAGAAWGATTLALRCSSLASAPATETLMYQLLGAFVLLLPIAGLSGQWHWQPSPTLWWHLGFQSLVVSFASFLAWFWLLRHYLASRLGVFSFLTPVLGVLLSVWLLDEPLEAPFLVGSVLVLAGIGLVNRPTGATGRRRL